MRKVLVRDHMAGVFVGELHEEPTGKSCTLHNARKIHYWTKAAAVEGIAATGSVGTDSRITPKVERVNLFNLVQIIEMKPEPYEKIKEYKTWKP